MLPKEVVHKVRRIQITTNRLVNESLAGEYHSVFKGRGMEFDEVREYQHGDDVRAIDWNVTSRAGRPFIKRYIEERELTVMLLIDTSASGTFGSAGKLKSEIAAEISALVTESLFAHLKAPPLRVTLPDVPAPASRTLEKVYFPGVDNVIQAVHLVLSHGRA